MTEILTFNTESESTQIDVIEPLPLFAEDYYMLKTPMPAYTEQLPNPIMTRLIERLNMTMKLYGGIGLSANQCGVAVRVFVIGTQDMKIACINPRIVGWSDDKQKVKEGCLSYPGLYLMVEREPWVIAEFETVDGKTVQTKLEGLNAQVYLHELDHMNGVRFADHVGPLALNMAKKRRDKMMKRIVRSKK